MRSSYYKLIFVEKDGTLDEYTLNEQPTTNKIASQTTPKDRYVLQRIGDFWEVYDVRTLRRRFPAGRAEDYTIGIPVFTHEDYDVAITYAVLMAGRE